MIKSNCSVRSSGDDRDLQSVHRQHQGQDRQGSAILPSIGQREGPDETQRAAYLAQVGLRAGARSRQRYYPVHPEPSTRPEEDTRRCKKRKSQDQRLRRPTRVQTDCRITFCRAVVEFARRLRIPATYARLEPSMAIGIEDRSTIREPFLVPEIFLVPPSIPFVGAPEPPVRETDQRLLHRPNVPRREPPVRVQGPQVEDSVSVDPPGAIHVWVHVGEHEIADRAEGRLSTVEARIPRSCDGSELASFPEQEDDVIDVVLRFEIEDRRRISLLLEDRRGGQRGLETMGLARPDDPAERAEGLPAFLVVVGERLEPSLHALRRRRPLEDATFPRREGGPWRGRAHRMISRA